MRNYSSPTAIGCELFSLALFGLRIDIFGRKQFAQRCLAVPQNVRAAWFSGEILSARSDTQRGFSSLGCCCDGRVPWACAASFLWHPLLEGRRRGTRSLLVIHLSARVRHRPFAAKIPKDLKP
jgi:hypothetical protein